MAVPLAACGLLGTEGGKDVQMQAQTDPEPVLSRTVGLPPEAHYLWYSGTLGSEAPGPSTYFVDARIEMDAESFTELTADCGDDGESVSPEETAVLPELQHELPGQLRACEALAETLPTGTGDAQVWIAQDDPVLVLALVGDGS